MACAIGRGCGRHRAAHRIGARQVQRYARDSRLAGVLNPVGVRVIPHIVADGHRRVREERGKTALGAPRKAYIKGVVEVGVLAGVGDPNLLARKAV